MTANHYHIYHLEKGYQVFYYFILHYIQVIKGHSSFQAFKSRGQYEGLTSIKMKSGKEGIYAVQYF